MRDVVIVCNERVVSFFPFFARPNMWVPTLTLGYSNGVFVVTSRRSVADSADVSHTFFSPERSPDRDQRRPWPYIRWIIRSISLTLEWRADISIEHYELHLSVLFASRLREFRVRSHHRRTVYIFLFVLATYYWIDGHRVTATLRDRQIIEFVLKTRSLSDLLVARAASSDGQSHSAKIGINVI